MVGWHVPCNVNENPLLHLVQKLVAEHVRQFAALVQLYG
jgi:hypothetical protein